MTSLTNKELSVLNVALSQPNFMLDTKLTAAVVTMTEMHFRPWLWRVFEYIVVILYSALGKETKHITLGVSQISIRHYCELLGFTEKQAILSALSAKKNLWVCCKLIEKVDALNLDDVANHYNGNSTIYYKRRLRQTYKRVHAFYYKSMLNN